jgi:hypothetical protein
MQFELHPPYRRPSRILVRPSRDTRYSPVCLRPFAVCSSTDTLPSFPMWPAFPSSEYYDGSAPSAPISRHRTYPPITRLAGAFAGASDEWFPRSLLFG